MKIGVLVAMSKEMELLKSFISRGQTEHGRVFDYFVGKVGKNEVVIQQCGIGKVNSALGAAEMITLYEPDFILSTGVAGSLDDELHSGDTIMGVWYHYHDVFCGKELVKGQVQGMPSTFAPLEVGINTKGDLCVRIGKILGHDIKIAGVLSGDQFIVDPKVKAKLKATYSLASVVDMESCSIAQTCYRYKVPFVAIRIISDNCEEEQYEDFWKNAAKWSFNSTKKILEELV